jgi:hypothetical protein
MPSSMNQARAIGAAGLGCADAARQQKLEGTSTSSSAMERSRNAPSVSRATLDLAKLPVEGAVKKAR